MQRLLHVLSFTHDLERARAFYRDGLGLVVRADTPFMASFGTDEAGLVLLAVTPTQRTEVELCFESANVSASVEALKARGVGFTDEVRHLSFGSVIHFRDVEDNLLSLLQPGTAAPSPATEASRAAGAERASAGGRGARGGGEAERAAGSLALADTSRMVPRLSTAIVNCRDLAGSVAYYRNLLGLHVSVDSPGWVQFDTGEVRLALHSRSDRRTPGLYQTQAVSFGFTVDDLAAWIDEARARGVELASAPSDEGFGLTAEVVDPEGNVVLVREPMSDETLEERLAEGFDEDAPRRAAIRSPVRKAAHHASWVATRPEYKPAKRPAQPKAPSQPKSLSDAKRARTKPAIGRLKKAEARTLGTAKKAAARASKSRPLKRAAAKRTAAKRPKRRGR